jgi:hypothetical protein
MKKFSKPPADKPHQCKFCGQCYAREKTLMNHICEYSRRWQNRDDKYVKIGFSAYQEFHKTRMRARKPKEYTDFIYDQFYIAFTKFGRHCLQINCINVDKFIEFVLRSEVPIDDWTLDRVYEIYVREWITRNEPADVAMERSILLMKQWAIDTGHPWKEFFNLISSERAVQLIRTGRLSPWILLTCKSAKQLFTRMDPESLQAVEKFIQTNVWADKLKNNPGDVRWLKSVWGKYDL